MLLASTDFQCTCSEAEKLSAVRLSSEAASRRSSLRPLQHSTTSPKTKASGARCTWSGMELNGPSLIVEPRRPKAEAARHRLAEEPTTQMFETPAATRKRAAYHGLVLERSMHVGCLADFKGPVSLNCATATTQRCSHLLARGAYKPVSGNWSCCSLSITSTVH